MSGPSPSSAKRRLPAPVWKKVFRWAAFMLLGIILIISAAALWAWGNRYALLERQAITYLQSQGIDADLDIRLATASRAEISNIRLAYDGEPFLTVRQLDAEYYWRDLLNGKVERLDFDGLDATLTVNEQGRIVDGWLPPTGQGKGGLPSRGIGLTEGEITIRTPIGPIGLENIQAELASMDQFEAEGRLSPSRIARDDVTVTIDTDRDSRFRLIASPEQPYEASLGPIIVSATHPEATLEDVVVSLDASVRRPLSENEIWTGQGRAVLTSGRAYGPDWMIDNGQMTLTMQRRPAGDTGTIELQLDEIAVTSPERRRTVAQTLSLSSALSDVPIASNFVPQLTSELERLLSGAQATGQMSWTHRDRQLGATLTAPLVISRNDRRLILSGREGEQTYAFDPDLDRISLAADTTLSHPVPLEMRDLILTIQSDTGFRVNGIEAAKGQLRSSRTWSAQSDTGETARLVPATLTFDYTNPGDLPARLRLEGGVDYGGPVPGGTITGLTAGGVLSATLPESGPVLRYTPSAPLRFDRLETTSEWSIERFDGRIDPTGPLYVSQGTDRLPRARIQTGLSEASFSAVRNPDSPDGTAEMDIAAMSATLSGLIQGSVQDWSVAFEGATLLSETFPVEQTDLTIPDGTLSARLTEDDRTDFTLNAPNLRLVTPGYTVRNMAVSVEGTAEAYEMSFKDGQVKLTQGEMTDGLPIFPASGTFSFSDGMFSGRAETQLPKAEDQPVNIDFTLNDGIGTAQVKIEQLRFQPGGLQPQELAPALRGQIAQVDGIVDAQFDIGFGQDQPWNGSGQVTIQDMSLGTAPGPVTGLSGTIELTSLFPIVTAPSQTLRLQEFDPGFPLQDGEITYALVDGGVSIERAYFPLGEGQVSFDPFTWRYGADQNRVTLRVADVELNEFLKNLGEGQISATGTIAGAIPVVVEGIDVRVEGGRLEVPNGGTIRYRPKEGENISERLPNEYAGQAFKALENFEYDRLFAELNGPLDGDLLLGMQFTGSNEDVLYDVPFAFDITVEGELFNIARSFNTNATIKSQVGRNLTVAE